MGPRPVFAATGRGPMLLWVAAKGRANHFVPLRCRVPLSLPGVLGEIIVILGRQERCGRRKRSSGQT